MPNNRTPPFEVRRSRIQGRGVFASRRIRPGARIIQYTGEALSPDEAYARYDDDSMERHHTFLFVVDDDTILDGAKGGNASRLINHSCDPNCEAVVEDGEIWVYALENIQPGTELLYDYAYERPGRYLKAWDALYECRCGSPKCRGTILKRPKPKRRKARAAKKAARSSRVR